MTVTEFLNRSTARELTELEAIERLDGPIGELRLDVLFAHALSVLVASNPFRGRGAPVPNPSDYLIRWDAAEGRDEPSQDDIARRAEEVRQKFLAIVGSQSAQSK